ncbi:hypothetical protein V5N11_014560 [Cardamine amara subsp. amara]|uniref:Prolamin-like domain-containing protein n=1 Tax=Cardamine amara subsp. amara TaxID=228776 RepID=A0ABD1BDG4_CARAN
MSGNKQITCVSILAVIVVILSIFQKTNGNSNSDHALAPMSEKGLLPDLRSCVTNARNIPNCVDALKQFRLTIIQKECCVVLVSLPGDCFGILFPMRFVFRIALKATCKLLGVF